MKALQALAALMLVANGALADDWPQWLGPKRDGSTTEKVAAWKDALKVLWKEPVGEGHSGPVVVKDRVFLHTRITDKDRVQKEPQEELSAFDAAGGKLQWRSAPVQRGKFADPFNFGTGPRATPAVVDGKVYTFGITGILSCIHADSGKVAWQVNTLKKYNAPNLFFGMSGSPLIVDDRVLVNVGGKGASVVAFDRDNGEEQWKALDDPASYSSPILVRRGRDKQVIFLTGRRLLGLSPLDGKLYWEHPFVDKLSESSTTPVVAGDVLFGSSVTLGGVALKLEAGEKGPTVKQLWMEPKYNCYFATPVPVGEYLYLVTGSLLAKKASLHCVEIATGKQQWTRENVGKYHASLLRTGDNKLLMLEEAGDLVLIEPDPKEYRELARSNVCGTTWVHPAVADGRLYIRDKTHLSCVQLPR
jgi:outer membrane protein assembly factor BamB